MSHATISGATSGEAWANTQDVYHFSINYGFRDAAGVQIPANLDGTAAADGNPITNPAGPWHNAALTKINFAPEQEAPWVTRAEHPGYVALSGSQTVDIDVWPIINGNITDQISVFVRVRNPSTASNRTFFSAGDGALGNRLLFVLKTDTDLSVFDSTAEFHDFQDSISTNWADDTWHDILFCANGTVAKCFVDGVLIEELAIADIATSVANWTRAKVLVNESGTGNEYQGDIARLRIYATAVTPASLESIPDLLDLRFRYDRVEDEKCRLPTLIYPTGFTPGTITIPTAYEFGDALPTGMSKQVNANGFEHAIRLEDYDE